MTTAGPWSVKGIDPKAREIAKDLARRSGMTLGEWLNHMIIEGEEDGAQFAGGQAENSPYDRAWLDAPRTRTQAAGFSATETLRARINRELGRDEPLRTRDMGRDTGRDTGRDMGRDIGMGHNSDAGELQRLGRLLAELSARIEGSDHRAGQQFSGIDQQVAGVISRVETAEREQNATAARLESVIDDVRTDHARLSDRLRRVDGDEEARMEAIKALEGALNKVAGQIYEGESRSRGVIAALREDVSALAGRVERAEAAPVVPDKTIERRLEAIAIDLARKVEEVRGETTARIKEASDGKADRLEAIVADLARKMEDVRGETIARVKEASDGKSDRLEQAIREVTARMGESEKRSGEAMDRMGREVMRVAQGMATRMQTVEGRSTAATEQMGSEMARIAETMEVRMRQADAAQAESIEKLGGELTRISEKLADRIAASERRAAGAVTHMGDQLSSVTDSFNQRSDTVAADIAERIRASEERTAKLVAETRESLERRVAHGHTTDAPPFGHHVSELPMAADFEPEPVEAAPPPQIVAPPLASSDSFGGHAFASSPFSDPHFDEAPLTASSTPAAAFEDPFAAPASLGGVFDDFPPEQPFATDPVFAHPQAHDAPRLSAPMPELRSTRDMIAAARAAARAASEGRGRRAVATPDPFADPVPAAYEAPYDPAFTAGEFSAPAAPPEVEVAADKARTGMLGFGFAIPRKKKEGPTLKTLLMASAVAATLSVTAVGAVGLVALDGKGGPKPAAPSAAPDPHAAIAALERSANDPLPSSPTTVGDTSGGAGDRLAVALSTPPPVGLAPPPSAAVPGLKPAALAPAAATLTPPAGKPGQPSAIVTPVAATQGAPRALYAAAVRQIEAGDASGMEGLKKAANLGYAPAEFYLAKLFETGNAGVKKDTAEARRWTERAAQAGDSKAMHNLALYWFEGMGGPKDPAQAADWFKRAAERGVQDSQYNLARLYEQGFGVSKSPAEAYKWYLVAGAGGDAEAKTGADTVKRQLSTDAQTQAEHAAASFRAQIAASQMRTASVE